MENKIDIEDYTRHYAKSRSSKYSFEKILDQIRRKNILKFVDTYPHKHILEVGCGIEPLFIHLKEYLSYTIVEPSPLFANNALRLSENNPKVRVIQGFFEEIPDELIRGNESFDFIILSSLLHEVPDPDKVLSKVRLLSNSTTIIHINVPNAVSFHRLLAKEMGIIQDVHQKSENDITFQRFRVFDEPSLIDLVERNGFEVLSSGTYFLKLLSNKQMERMLELEIVSLDLIEGLERMVKYMPKLGAEIYVNIKRRC